MRIFEPLPASVELAAKLTIGAAIAVHRALGPGFLERIYQEALCLELQARNIGFERQRPVAVHYRGVAISGQRIDLIVEACLVVELKAVSRFDAAHDAQLPFVLADDWPSTGTLAQFQLPDPQGWDQKNRYLDAVDWWPAKAGRVAAQSTGVVDPFVTFSCLCG